MPLRPDFDRAVAFASDLIRIPSRPGEEGEIAERVLLECRRLGFDDVWQDEVGNVLARIRGREPRPTLLLSSHLDAVDVGDPDGWEHPPFGGRVVDGFLHGRGAMDIKGPLAIQTYAAASFVADRPRGDLVLCHTVLEERGGWGMDHFLESGEVGVDGAIIGEATNGDICIGHRGRAELNVEIRGVAAHASAPERGRNPFDILPDVLSCIGAFARQLPRDPALGPSTLTVTAVDVLPRSHNVIPDRLRLWLDWRILPDDDPDDRALRLLHRLQATVTLPDGFGLTARVATELQRTYTGVERERPLATHGFMVDPDHALVLAAAAAVDRVTGKRPTVRPWTFASDGGAVCGKHGIPTIGYAPGDESLAHTNRERLELASARTVFDAYPAVITAAFDALGGR